MKDVDAAWINKMDLQAGVHRSAMNADCPVSGEGHENLLNAVHRALPGLRRIARDAEVAEKFPICGVDILRRLGLLAAPLPRNRGGNGWGTEGNATLFEALRLLGSASLVLGRVYEGHVNAIRLIACYASPEIAMHAAKDVLGGHLFAIWVTPSADPVRIHCTERGYRVIGKKPFCSGAGQATRAVITARDDLGDDRLVWVDAGKAIVEPDSAIQMHGMRSTDTRPVRFDMDIDTDPIIGKAADYLREPEFSAGAWRTSAVTVGGLQALVTETIAQLRARDRHVAPHQSARIGQMLIASHTALMWGRKAASEAERTDLPPQSITAGVNLARVAIESCCLTVIPLVQRSLGLAGLLTSNPVESMIRDLATYLRQPAADEALSEAACWFAENGFGDNEVSAQPEATTCQGAGGAGVI